MTLRLSFRAVVSAAIIGCGLFGATVAETQDAPARRPAATSAVLPSKPIPYTSTVRRRAPRPRPAAPVAARTATPTRATTATAATAAAPPTAASPETAAPALSPAPASSTVAPLPPADLEAYVDGVVRDRMARDHIAGVTVAVVQNGQVVLKKGYGVASLRDRRQVDPDTTLFRVGSISKTFTWIALMNEVEAGRMRLDAPINVYLPEKLQLKDQGKKTPVRLRDLMTHTAGFEDRALGQLFERDPRRERPLELYLRQERPNRVREPGLLPAYSNYGVGLAGEALANVTGQPFEKVIADQVILPAGLTHTTFRENRPWRDDLPAPMAPALAAGLSDGFRWTPLGFQTEAPEFIGHIAPAGAASSTAGDMARYMTLLLNGGTIDGRTIFSPRTSAMFRTPMYRPAEGAPGWNAGFMDIPLPGGRRGFGHAGATLWFHSNLVMVPELGLGVFVAVNTDTGADLPASLPSTIIERFYAPRPEIPAASKITRDEARAYEGQFLTTRRAYGGLEGFIDRLIGQATVRAAPDGRLTLTIDGQSSQWTATDQPDTFAPASGAGLLVFQREDGKVARFFSPTGGAAFERIDFPHQRSLLTTFAVLAALAALATLVGVATRDRREARQTPTQARASLLQTIQAILWLVALVGVGVFASGADDMARAFYGWPSGWLLSASACAFVATLLTIATLAMLPVVWRGGRRVDSWTALRKLAFSCTTLIFLGFALLLAAWGFLEFWNA
ncbi:MULTISPECIES: serine hydrolase [Caulobacter]|uniref:CubicO group peptidase (Beta-lactamase class C family) n=1 Tax=Caulobacter rhizosphaerae TaxID=2010972 RepID=A0ABU1MZN7_9CAUL|nr:MULTISPECIES: serine hydrolase domain-containing protein [Caulobacter]KQZ18419.1 serine hydrolase [Caulobacter sp. Root1472]MDR6531634.1 CubicO group peptidase (beta-lactamase class C family) [Caulobacter rhizosphaerae]